MFFSIASRAALAAALGLGSTLVALPAANAEIACRDGFQLVQGSLIATPYCQDALVAKVARERGFKVSAREIRENPNTKRHVCQFVGHDIRIRTTCTDANGFQRGPRG